MPRSTTLPFRDLPVHSGAQRVLGSSERQWKHARKGRVENTRKGRVENTRKGSGTHTRNGSRG